MVETWEQHLAAEFDLHSTEAALATMTDNPHVIHVATPDALGVEAGPPLGIQVIGETPLGTGRSRTGAGRSSQA